MKKHLKILEYMLIIALLLYGMIYLISHGTGNYMDDGIELGFYFVRISLGQGVALIAISYIVLRVGKKWISLVLTIINSIVACIFIGFSIFNLETTILVDNFSNKYLVANTLINLRNTKRNAESAMFDDLNSVTRCNIAEVLCIIIQVAIVIIVLYSLFILIMMLTKNFRNEIETKKEYEKDRYVSVLRVINILLGVILSATMIYLTSDFYGAQSREDALYNAIIDLFFAYLIPAILLLKITDEWIKRREYIKPLIFYIVYSFWAYFGITYFIPGENHVDLAWIYAILVDVTTMTVFFKIIYSIRDRGRIRKNEKTF